MNLARTHIHDSHVLRGNSHPPSLVELTPKGRSYLRPVTPLYNEDGATSALAATDARRSRSEVGDPHGQVGREPVQNSHMGGASPSAISFPHRTATLAPALPCTRRLEATGGVLNEISREGAARADGLVASCPTHTQGSHTAYGALARGLGRASWL